MAEDNTFDISGIVTWLNGWFPFKGSESRSLSEVVSDLTSKINNKADNSVVSSLQSIVNNKLDISSYVVDNALNSSSENPVQNKVVNNALSDKVDKESGKGLSTNDYTTAEKNKLAGIEAQANKTVVDSVFSNTSSNPVQNKLITQSIASLNQRIRNIDVEVIKVVSDKGTASADTMNKLYIEVGENNTDIYYTVEEDGSYSWQSLDTDILDSLSINWADIQNKPTKFAPTSHNSTTSEYGLGAHTVYGHTKVINDLTHSSYGSGESLSAYQGYLLKQSLNSVSDGVDELYEIKLDSSDFTISNIPWGSEEANATEIQAQNFLSALVIISGRASKGLSAFNSLDNKADKSDVVDWSYNSNNFVNGIRLVPKSEDSTGTIEIKLKS